MRMLIAALTGGLFGAGLLISGMTDTAKVQGFLDILGAWDPTLAFVLGGAIAPMVLAGASPRGNAWPCLGTCPSPLPRRSTAPASAARSCSAPAGASPASAQAPPWPRSASAAAAA